MAFADLPARLDAVRECIARRQRRGGWSHPVRIVAVTKSWGPEAVQAAAAAGLTEIGENRVQEALAKQDALADLAVDWHLIGHLQTNKVRHVMGRFGLIHSVDSERLAHALSARASGAHAGATAVLLQVNVAGESQKFGCSPADAAALARRIANLPGLDLRGLMTMAPFANDEARQRPAFRALRLVREQLEAEGLRLPELSMGMSDDFPVAVEEGATLIRLGTVLFGERTS